MLERLDERLRVGDALIGSVKEHDVLRAAGRVGPKRP
jgi:hypothetical protein